MRIGIDARTILNPEKGDAIGVGHYTYQLIRHLLKIDKENDYVLFFDFRVREKDIKKFTQPNVTIKFYPFSDYRKYLPGAYNEILGTATLQREKLDVLHSTYFASRIPASYSGKTVVTFQSMAMYEVPQYMPQLRRLKDKTVAKMMANKADRIIAGSQSLKKELLQHLGATSDKVEVIYSGLDARFYEEPSLEEMKVIERFGISKRYILFLGTLEPSKNITRLLEAFAQFKEKMKSNGKFNYQLVLAGKRGWLSPEFHQQVKDLGLSNDVIFTGYVVGDELVPLFKGAQFFIMPSLYEGFGMTVLEAFATKTPAILSNVTSLPEVAGDAAYFINPANTAEIVDAMVRFATDEAIRDAYREKGYQRAQQFNWEDAARQTLDVYRSLV